MNTVPPPPGIPIRFFKTDERFGELSNFWVDNIEHDGRVYPTGEHLYQCLRFYENKNAVESILNCENPYRAQLLGNWIIDTPLTVKYDWQKSILKKVKKLKKEGLVDNFDRLETMKFVLLAKFTQSENLKNILLSTGDNSLIYSTNIDDFWGDANEGSNNLGKLLESVRNNF